MSLVPCRSDLRPEAGGGVSLWYIATRAGRLEASGNWLLNYVRLLIANEGFPPPLPAYTAKAVKKPVGLSSRWSRDAVDAWFDGFLPPVLSTARDEIRAGREAAALDARAALLAGLPAGQPLQEHAA